MDHELDLDDGKLLGTLAEIPRKILLHYEVQDLPEIVLHHISHDDVFGFDKAVYLVDNPDFDCLKGVAGYSCDECKFHSQDVWSKPENFHTDMRCACFNSQIKHFIRNGLRRKGSNKPDENEILELGEALGIKNPAFLSWNMQHGNNGILIFHTPEHNFGKKQNLLMHAGPLLSLC